jgi:hypothetical protein
MIDPHINPELAINGLRLLLDGYKVFRDRFRDKKTPERVEEILAQADKTPGKAAEIEQNLAKSLEPGDAAIVKGDLELLSLLVHPVPEMDAFDYWGQLTKLVGGLHTYAVRGRLFELRGRAHPTFGETLMLPTSGVRILPDEQAIQLAVPNSSRQGVKSAFALALLRKDAKNFPITALVRAEFNEYHSMGGPPSVIPVCCRYSITCGQQRHWLRFERLDGSYHFTESYEYMLNASDLIAIMEALRDDIRKITVEVEADEQKIAPFLNAIDAFSKEMSR